MTKICLKDGKEVMIREAEKEDAQMMIDFYNLVGGETDFLSFGKNEFNMTLNDYEKFIGLTKEQNNAKILLATINDEIISIASITSNPKSRFKHVGTLGIVIEKKYCGLGLGRKIIEDLIVWAKSNGTTKKISLVTREDNHNAIDLYKKVGFEVEGLSKKDSYINDVYYNTLMMGLIF